MTIFSELKLVLGYTVIKLATLYGFPILQSMFYLTVVGRNQTASSVILARRKGDCATSWVVLRHLGDGHLGWFLCHVRETSFF